MNENRFDPKSLLMPLWQGFIIFLAFYAVKMLVFFSVAISTLNADQFLDDNLSFIPCLIAMPFIYNSIIYIGSVYNKRKRESFLLSAERKPRRCLEIKNQLSSPEFLIQFSVITVLTVIVSLAGGFFELNAVLFNNEGNFLQSRLLPCFILVPLFFIISLHRYFETRLYWWQLYKRGEIENLDSYVPIIFRSLALVLGYPMIFPGITYLFLALFSVINVVGSLVNLFTVFGFFAIIISVILLCLLICTLHALNTRRKFIKKLKREISTSEYTSSDIKRPYASLFRNKSECNFTIEGKGRKFSVRLIGSWWQRAPLHFISDKHAMYLHKIGTRKHFFSYETHFNYGFDAEGTKLLILCPVPRKIYASVSDTESIVTPGEAPRGHGISTTSSRHKTARNRLSAYSRELDTGDKVWEYVIYNTTGLMSAIDRGCLGRYISSES